MNMIRIAVLLLPFAVSAGPAQAFDLFHQEPTEAEAAASDDATCRGYGVARGSNNYVACRMNLANNRAAQGMVRSAHRARTSRLMMLLGAGAAGGWR